MHKTAPLQSTQKYLNILAIREGTVILRDGGLRLILSTNSLNFALKSEDEQNSIIGGYQSFLNSLKFPIHIVMQSRRLDLFAYLRMLREAMEKQTNEMLRLQTEDYIDYIERLIARANIMDKRFFVVIPYFPTGLQQTTLLDRLLSATKSKEVHYTTEQFKEYQQKLTERANLIISGLGSLGISAAILNTQEVVELFYGVYNPEEALSERLTQVNDLSVPVVTSNNKVDVGKKQPETSRQAAQVSSRAVGAATQPPQGGTVAAPAAMQAVQTPAVSTAIPVPQAVIQTSNLQSPSTAVSQQSVQNVNTPVAPQAAPGQQGTGQNT